MISSCRFPHALATVAIAASLSGCVQTPNPEVDPLTAALAGKTLVNEGGAITVGRDGSLSGTVGNGTPLVGAWAVRDGQWCRTIEQPARLAGTECQRAVLNGDGTVTIDGVNGPGTFEIR
jgi:hypothetical protein